MVAQQLRTPNVLAEDPIAVKWLPTACNSSSRGNLMPLASLGTYIHMHILLYAYFKTKLNESKNKKTYHLETRRKTIKDSRT